MQKKNKSPNYKMYIFRPAVCFARHQNVTARNGGFLGASYYLHVGWPYRVDEYLLHTRETLYYRRFPCVNNFPAYRAEPTTPMYFSYSVTTLKSEQAKNLLHASAVRHIFSAAPVKIMNVETEEERRKCEHPPTALYGKERVSEKTRVAM